MVNPKKRPLEDANVIVPLKRPRGWPRKVQLNWFWLMTWYCITAFEIVEIKFDLLMGGYRYSAVAIILPIRAGFFLFFKILFYGKIRVKIVN